MQNFLLNLFNSASHPSTSYSYTYSKHSHPKRPSHSYWDWYSDREIYVYILTQLAPFLILLGLPALVLLARHFLSLDYLSYCIGSWVRRLVMVFESLFGSALPSSWGWSGSGHGNNGEKGREGRRRRRARNKDGEREKESSSQSDSKDKESELEEEEDDDSGLYYPGLVNISGTYCFLNSVLQATASLAYLQPYIDVIHARAVELDVPTPVVDTLQETIQSLDTPKTSRSALRPVPIINALSQPVPGSSGRSKLFASREHQDAQELFQLLSECVRNEAQAVDAEAQRDRGLGSFASPSSSSTSLSSSSSYFSRSLENGGERERENELSALSVFDGLTANRRSCVVCGYTEAVMHFAFATWSLALPSVGSFGTCTLQDCLSEYTRLELLTDCICRRCSMRATHARLKEDVEKLVEATKPGGPAAGSQYKKKKLREERRLERLVESLIGEGRVEEDVKGLKMERVISPASTKQAMIARPPKILVLHLNRSVHLSSYAGPSRNPIRVRFPEILDLTPYTTSGQLSTSPSAPISTPPPPPPVSPRSISQDGSVIKRSTTPTQGMYDHPRVLYRLSAVVAHYGGHSFGHYVCFRRKPRFSRNGKEERKGKERRAQPMVPRMPCSYGCECQLCTTYGPIRDFDPSSSASQSSQQSDTNRPPRPGSNKGWLRISDDSVEEVGIESVLAEGSGAFLLFYEKVVQGPNTNGWYSRSLTPSSFLPSSSLSSLPLPLAGPSQTNGGRSGMEVGGQRKSSISDGVGVGIGVGIHQSTNSHSIGLGSVYQHLRAQSQLRGTPRSSEETVKPATVINSSSTEYPSSAYVGFGAGGGGGGNLSDSMGSGSSSVSSSLSSSWSGSLSGSGSLRPRVVRRTTAGRRERTTRGEERGDGERSRSRSRDEEVDSGIVAGGKGKGKEIQGEESIVNSSRSIPNGWGVQPNGNGSAIPNSLTNGSALRANEVDDLDGLSESIVRVEVPSSSRSRSPSPSPSPSLGRGTNADLSPKSKLKAKSKGVSVQTQARLQQEESTTSTSTLISSPRSSISNKSPRSPTSPTSLSSPLSPRASNANSTSTSTSTSNSNSSSSPKSKKRKNNKKSKVKVLDTTSSSSAVGTGTSSIVSTNGTDRPNGTNGTNGILVDV